MARAMSGDAARLTVIIPAFNEGARLAKHASRLNRAVEHGFLCHRTTELIVVDDGSTDDTAWRAEELLSDSFPRLRILRLHHNAGKGAAVRLGTSAASAPVVVFMDADMAVDPAEIPRLVKAIGPADVAIGSRSLDESIVESATFQRKLMGRSFNTLVRALTDVPFRDTQCGFKAFRTPVARMLFHLMRTHRFAFDVEVLCLAQQLRMEIAEIAVVWREAGHSTVRPLVDPLSMMREVLAVRSRREWPNLPALAITPARGERRRSQSRIAREVHLALGPNFPIIFISEDQSLVLLPLCDPDEVQRNALRLRSLSTNLTVRERSVEFSQLTELVPFQWIAGENDGSMVASATGISDLVIRTPIDGWQSMRETTPLGSHLWG
jgi:dolichyl-phosphate beta-glucosyltransferase